MIDELMGAILGAFGAALGGDAGLRRAAKRLRAEGKVLGSIRLRIGEQDGTSKRWRVREMTPGKGRISFNSTSINVEAVYRRSDPPTRRTQFGIQLPEPLVVFDLQAENAQLELAVAAEDADRVIDVVAARPETEGPTNREVD